MSGADETLRAKYDAEYYERYNVKNLLGRPIGERNYFYSFWTRFVTRLLAPGASILEVGCGRGYLARRLTPRYQVYATDVSAVAAGLAGQAAPEARIFLADAQRLPLPRSSVDCVIAFDVIEHLPSPERFVAGIHDVLKPGGACILATPNPGSLGARLKGRPQPGADERWEDMMDDVWHGWRDDTHINIRTIDQWRELLAKADFTVVRDGTDFCWDTPYFKRIPRLAEKLVLNGSNRVLTAAFGFLPWRLGENYVVLARARRSDP